MPQEEFGETPQENKERTIQDLEALSSKLGFSETEILLNLEQEIVDNPEQRLQLMEEWLSSAEKTIDGLSEDKKINAQIGLIVRQAIILRKAGMTSECKQTLEQAIDISYQLGQDDIVQELIKF